jgi:hypothetical protein
MLQHQHNVVILTHARAVITDWKGEYAHHRRTSAPGYQTPASYAPPAPTNNRPPLAVDHKQGIGLLWSERVRR